jgi:MscS family membrane protein
MTKQRRSTLARLLEVGAGRRAALLLALAALWLCATPVLARRAVALAAAGPTQEEPARANGGETFKSPAEIGSTIHAFMQQQRGRSSAGSERAALIFELGDRDARQRRHTGETLLATRLVPILERTTFIAADGSPFADAGEIEASPNHDSWDWTSSAPGRPDVVVNLGFARQSGGGWLIDGDTVARLEGLYQQVKHLPRLAGMEHKPLSIAEWVRDRVPDRLERGGFLLQPYQWIGIVVLIVLGFVIERLAKLFLRPVLRRMSKGRVTIDSELLGGFERPFGAVIATLVFLMALPALDLEPRRRDVLDIAASLVLAVASVWAVYRLVDVLSWFLEQKALRTAHRFDDMLVPLVRRTVKVLVLIVGLVFVASRLTSDLWGIFAGLSIGSLALGFAAKESVENLFGTFTVLLDKPFKLGDLITVGEFSGTVEEVGFRSTRVRTAEDSLITMPNSRFIGTDIENLSARRRRRVNTTLALTYDTPPQSVEAFCEGVRELIRAHPWTWKEGYHVWLTGFGTSSLDVALVYFIDTQDHATFLREQHRLNLDIVRLAQQLEVEFAFPTQTMHVPPTRDPEQPRGPADQSGALHSGREQARALSARTFEGFAGQRPPPVRFDPADPDAQGPGAPRR